MTVLQDILQWSQESKRPAWQRDALRRLLANGGITTEDIDELVQIILNKQGLHTGEEEVPGLVPLAAADLPEQGVSTEATTLLTLCDIANVNALVGDQSITFSETGFTIIYGDNGAGKSGYARILKRACRERESGKPILPNVFNQTEGPAADAKIQYKRGASVDTLHWQDGQDTKAMLSAVSFFDAECASIHVGDSNSGDTVRICFALSLK